MLGDAFDIDLFNARLGTEKEFFFDAAGGFGAEAVTNIYQVIVFLPRRVSVESGDECVHANVLPVLIVKLIELSVEITEVFPERFLVEF